MTVPDVIDFLRIQRHAAVSFVESPSPSRVSIAPDDANVKEALHQLVAQNPAYRLADEGGHLVVLPAGSEFDAVVTGVDIAAMSRLDAAEHYLQHLRATIPAFGTLHGVAVKGDSRSPVYGSRVSLAPEATVLTHLIQLLGDDPDVVFSIHQLQSGGSLLSFAAVQPSTSVRPHRPPSVD